MYSHDYTPTYANQLNDYFCFDSSVHPQITVLVMVLERMQEETIMFYNFAQDKSFLTTVRTLHKPHKPNPMALLTSSMFARPSV